MVRYPALGHARDVRQNARLLTRAGILAIPSLRAWFNMLQRDSYEISGGTVVAIRNQKSGVAMATSATAFPLYADMNGRPCMQGNAAGGRGIITTESDVANVFVGNDPSMSIIAVIEPTTQPANGVYLGAGSSAAAVSRTHSMFQITSTEKLHVNRIDDSGATDNFTRGAETLMVPQVVSFTLAGTRANFYVNQGLADPLDNVLDVGVTTPNRVAMFCRPDSAPDSFWDGKFGEWQLYNECLDEARRRALVYDAMMRWGIA